MKTSRRSGPGIPGKKAANKSECPRNISAHLKRKTLQPGAGVQDAERPGDYLKAVAASLTAATTRRQVLKTGALAAGAAALPSGLIAGGPGSGKKRGQHNIAREPRSFIFDFSWTDTSHHDVVLVSGTHHVKVKEAKPGKLRQLRSKHPVLNLVPDERATHHIDVDMPAESIQWCYLKRVDRRKNDGSWDLLMTFIHHPTRALHGAAAKESALLGDAEFPKVPDKWKGLGLTGLQHSVYADPVGLDTFKDCNDTACQMISGHPEVLCLDDTNSSYIHNTITSQNTDSLAGTIMFLQPAQKQSNWVDCSTPFQQNAIGYATLVPVCNADTGEQVYNSQDGSEIYIPVNADQTNDSLNSDGLQPSLAAVKQDTTLGGNISSEPDATSGYIWRTQDGVTTSDQDDDSLGLNDELSYTTKNFSPNHGYSVTINSVDDSPTDLGVTAVIDIEVQNWFVRFLGLYIRYLDADGNIVPTDSIRSELGASTVSKYFSYDDEGFSTSKEFYLDLLFPEFEVFGAPFSETDKTFSIPIPASANSIEILAGGMGNTDLSKSPYAETTYIGGTMTGVVSQAITFLFLTMAAASAYSPMSKSLQASANTRKLLPIFIELFVDLFEASLFSNPGAFKGLALKVATLLYTSSFKPILQFLAPFIAEAEEEDAVLDAVPFIGAAYAAFTALGTLAQLAQSAVEVATSPSTYVYEVTLTHDIPVTVRPNLSPPPDGDPNGWPATATTFQVRAHFDGGTPVTVTGTLPPTQTTAPQTVVFRNVPLGGQVTMSVSVYSDNDFVVGSASAGPEENVEDLAFDITFKELLVPLDASTVYTHKEVIELNAAGEHVWKATTTPPTQEPPGCSPSNGQLCSLDGITVNSAAGAVGQSFKSYNSAVSTCDNPNSFSNGDQFSNISSTETPESEFFFAGCTFRSSPRLVYDLLNRNNRNFYLDTSSTGPQYKGIIRQVRVGANNNPGFDGPDSNLAWGKLQFPSDSLLLHPAGKIVSIANTANKFEVIDLADAAVADADAPFSNTYAAKGLRPGLLDGPVLAALDPDGTILVIEDGNKRIQAFDLNGNAAPIFPGNNYFVPLKDQPVKRYLDFAIEFKGYMYVLLIVDSGGTDVYTLDIYSPTGEWLAATTGFAAQRLTVNYWRDVYAQNSQVLKLPNGAIPARTEPSISHWIPSTP